MNRTNKMQASEYTKRMKQNEKHILHDKESGSKALLPLQIDRDCEAELIQIDKGMITDLPEGGLVCDNIVFTLENQIMNLKITWLIELKGTKKEQEVRHAIKQIEETINYLNDSVKFPEAAKYLEQRDYVFAAVAGAPDKTLPIMNNAELKSLCRKLYANSGKRKQIRDMFMLFCYISPNKNCEKALVTGTNPPYKIQCYSKTDGYIPYPSMLLELIK